MTNLPHFDPLNELSAYGEALRQFIATGWGMSQELLPAGLMSVLVPVDVIETDDAVVIRANVPGVPEDELKITLSGHSLTIKGEAKDEGELENPRFIRRERRMATISRTVDLPMEVDAEHARAHFRDGVLILTLPKNEDIRAKRIRITKESPSPTQKKEK